MIRVNTCFQIDAVDRIYFLEASSKEERDRWVEKVSEAVENKRRGTSLNISVRSLEQLTKPIQKGKMEGYLLKKSPGVSVRVRK